MVRRAEGRRGRGAGGMGSKGTADAWSQAARGNWGISSNSMGKCPERWGTVLTILAGDAYSASVVRALRDAWPLRRAGELAP